MDHALSCKEGGFISLSFLKIICRDVLIEPTLQQLTGESLHERTRNITDEARVVLQLEGSRFLANGHFCIY